MEDLKDVIAKNLVELRTKAHFTQLELAEKINYTDKAVSKWERGEAIPDLRVIIKLAEIYNISVDDIVTKHPERKIRPKMNTGKKRLLITMLSAGLVWFIMTVIFMIFFFIPKTEDYAYLVFICAPLVCAIPLIVFSAKWGNWITNTLACSLLVWSFAAIFYVFVGKFAPSFDKIYVVFIVAGVFELLIIWWYMLRRVLKRRK
ncbi:MAG: helix-turn-helix domain-containing protein [Clostridia bacterium]|nr:helix-turn-helix domain-containing protein [Clostridia bacterium]